jgi:hypothetical protein
MVRDTGVRFRVCTESYMNVIGVNGFSSKISQSQARPLDNKTIESDGGIFLLTTSNLAQVV